jgi:tartrate dehydratase alpha subunit/fumarate hydratase class I-like protein
LERLTQCNETGWNCFIITIGIAQKWCLKSEQEARKRVKRLLNSEQVLRSDVKSLLNSEQAFFMNVKPLLNLEQALCMSVSLLLRLETLFWSRFLSFHHYEMLDKAAAMLATHRGKA